MVSQRSVLELIAEGQSDGESDSDTDTGRALARLRILVNANPDVTANRSESFPAKSTLELVPKTLTALYAACRELLVSATASVARIVNSLAPTAARP